MGKLILEGDGFAVGGESGFRLAQALVGEAEVVAGLDVRGLEA